MLDIITKKEYFQWLDKDYVIRRDGCLKDIQDGFIISILQDYQGKRVAEMGGAYCRVMRDFYHSMECWNIDKLNFKDKVPKVFREGSIKHINSYIGDFSEELPADYFDLVFSISVLEHIKKDDMTNVFLDIFRILKSGGKSYHAVDMFLGAAVESNTHVINYRLKNFLQLVEETGFQLIEPGIMDVEQAASNPAYAANSDHISHRWCREKPELRKQLEVKQVVSVKLGFRKP